MKQVRCKTHIMEFLSDRLFRWYRELGEVFVDGGLCGWYHVSEANIIAANVTMQDFAFFIKKPGDLFAE